MDYTLILIVMIGAYFLFVVAATLRQRRAPEQMGTMLDEQKRGNELLERVAVALEKIAASKGG